MGKSKKEREKTGLFVVEGLRIALDAAEAGAGVETTFVSESALEKHGEECSRMAPGSRLQIHRIVYKRADADGCDAPAEYAEYAQRCIPPPLRSP